MAELSAQGRQAQIRAEIDGYKAEVARLKNERESAEGQAKAMYDAELKSRDQEIKAAQIRLEDARKADAQAIEMYKAMLQSGTTLTAEQMKLSGASEGGAAGMFESLQMQTAQTIQESIGAVAQSFQAELGSIRAALVNQQERSAAPRAVKRDANGLIVSIGDVPVQRDEAGRVTQIG